MQNGKTKLEKWQLLAFVVTEEITYEHVSAQMQEHIAIMFQGHMAFAPLCGMEKINACTYYIMFMQR